MESLQQNDVKFDVFKTLYAISQDSVLDSIFRKNGLKTSYTSLLGLAKENSLGQEIVDRVKEMFERIILNSQTQLDRYLGIEDSNEPAEEVEEVEVKSKPTRKLPKHYGKQQIEKDIADNGGIKTELDNAMLAFNDIRNTMAKLRYKGISDKMLGTKKLTDEDCRNIAAATRIFVNKLNYLTKKK
jgi:hypothetical protein